MITTFQIVWKNVPFLPHVLASKLASERSWNDDGAHIQSPFVSTGTSGKIWNI